MLNFVVSYFNLTVSCNLLLNIHIEDFISTFRKKGINKFTWQRIGNGRLVERAMMDHVLVEKSVLGRLVDVHVARGAGGGVSDHILVVAKVKGGARF